MNNNFFKRCFLTIFITFLLIIAVIFIFYKLTNNSEQEPSTPDTPQFPINETTSILELNPNNNDSKPNLSNEKQETEKQQFQNTSERFAKIKAYVYSDPNDNSLLPNDFTKTEKVKIDELVNDFNERKQKDKLSIKELQEAIDNYNSKINEIQKQFFLLQKQKTILETEYNLKKNELNNIKERSERIKRQNNVPEYNRLIEQHNHLSNKINKLIEPIFEINTQIGILESKQEMYKQMISDTNKLKTYHEINYKDIPRLLSIDEKLLSFYEINPFQSPKN